MRSSLPLLMLVCLAPVLAGADPAADPAQLGPDGRMLDFGPSLDLAKIACNGTTVARGGTVDAPALRITSEANRSWPGATVPAPGGAWDLSPYEFISVEVHNIDNHDIDVAVRVDNPGADGRSNCYTEGIGTQPDQRVTMTIPIKRASNSGIKLFAMNGFPQGLYANGGIDAAKIIALTIFTGSGERTHRFEVANVRAFGRYAKPVWMDMTPERFFPCIDTYGQFKHKEWPGKIHGDQDLIAAKEAEAKALAADKGPAEWDAWGGWAMGPKLEATGHFRTAKHQGRWWLVDPDGRLFFSVGLTCVGSGWGSTMIDDRESWFEGLPKEGDPLRQFLTKGQQNEGNGYYAGRKPANYNFTNANLLRKYGPDWSKGYDELIHKRLRAWGLNSIGNWSSWEVMELKRTAYTRTFFYDVARMKNGAANFPDVFAANFAESLDRGTAQFLGTSKDDPWCIGYFVDNEMPWGGDDTLARYALESPAGQAAKQALAEWLKRRHPTIADLNAAWGTGLASWEAFLADTAIQTKGGTAQKDLVDFTGVVAETYFRSIKEAIRRFGPKKLYLGCRCVGGGPNVIGAAARHCDVVSFNRYCNSVRDSRMPDGLDAPMMIGEFHFGGLDRGPFWAGLCSADNQEDRGRKFAAYVRSALDNPQMVGVHWFQYGDEATTGRADGENAQCGFVDNCDTPYVETIKAARASAEAMYRIRATGK